MFAAALLLLPGERRWVIGLAVGLLAFSVVVDPSAVLLVGPVMLWFVASHLRHSPRRYLVPVGCGMTIPLTWLAVTHLYTTHHPDHDLHPQWPVLAPTVALLKANLGSPGKLLDVHAPGLIRHWWVIPLLLGAELVSCLVQRKVVPAVCILAVVGGLILLMSLPKSTDGFATIFFRSARLTTSVPAAVWFVSALTVSRRVGGHPLRRLHSEKCPRWLHVVSILILLAGVATFVQTTSDLAPLRAVVVADSAFPVAESGAMLSKCNRVVFFASSVRSSTVVFPFDRTAAYACAALTPGLTTVFPPYERRWWVLDQLNRRRSSKVVFVDVGSDFCTVAADLAHVQSCSRHRQMAVVTLSEVAPLDVVHELGIPIRPFGADCQPQVPVTCRWFARRFRQ